MTIIDTTLHYSGALRLANHGAGKGGIVLTHVATGEQIDIHPATVDAVLADIAFGERRALDARYMFESIQDYEREYAELQL